MIQVLSASVDVKIYTPKAFFQVSIAFSGSEVYIYRI